MVQELPRPGRQRAVLPLGRLAPLPAGESTLTEAAEWRYTSAYVEGNGELGDLVAAADGKATSVQAARSAWRQRRQAVPGQPPYLDTRYDAGHVLGCQSRRLVDVCSDLRLDVTQPELRGASMTALHRRWTEHGDAAAREKITVLNLRHSLSTAIVAARAAGLARWQPGLNVNRMLAGQLGGELRWTASPAFTALLGEPGAA